jgi:DNA-binding response OmpR family regulator
MVDDEAAIRELYTLYFQMQGFTIRTASNAIDALHEIYSQKFDLAILDLGLGDSNGIDLIEPIKTAQPDILIFIYTALDCDEIIRAEAIRLGALKILTKSHPLDYVAAEVQRALTAHRSKPSLQNPG